MSRGRNHVLKNVTCRKQNFILVLSTDSGRLLVAPLWRYQILDAILCLAASSR
jgi:hypothetical protein